MKSMRTQVWLVIGTLALISLLVVGAQAQDCRDYENYLCWKGNVPVGGANYSPTGDIDGTSAQYSLVMLNDGFFTISTTADPLDPDVYGPVLPFGQFTSVIKSDAYNWVADSDSGLVLINASDVNNMYVQEVVDVPAFDLDYTRDFILCAGKSGGFSTVTRNTTNPELQHTIAMPGDAWAVAVDEGLRYAYVACWDAGLAVVDLDTTPPSVVATVDTLTYAVSACVADTLLFLGTSNQYVNNGDLQILSISDPLNPRHLATVPNCLPWGMSYIDGGLYVAALNLKIIAFEDPAHPSVVEEVGLTGQAKCGVLATDDLCYVPIGFSYDGPPGVNVLTKPTHSFRGSRNTWAVGEDVHAILAEGDFAYVLEHADPGRLIAVDLTDGSVSDEAEGGIYTHSMAWYGDYIIATAEYDGLVVFEVTAPGDIEYVTEVDLPADHDIYAVDTYEHYAYASALDTCVQVVDLATPTSPVWVSEISGGMYTSINALDVFDGILYVGYYSYDGYPCIRAYDLAADPLTPPVLGELVIDLDSDIDDIKVVGGMVYACGPLGLTIADFEDPANPVHSSQMETAGSTLCLDVSGTWVYLGSSSDGVYIVDAFDPTAPEIIGHISAVSPAQERPADILIHGDDVLFTDGEEYLSVGYRECDEILDVPEGDAVSGKRPGLRQNHPNPFNPKTSVSYTLPADGHARLGVYNIAGRLVATLVDGPQTAGEHMVEWDGRTDTGEEAASGVYFCRLETDESHRSISMVLLK